jgi:hypothetical protein
MPINALVGWSVVRSCVNGLRFAQWLGEIALGAALAGIVSAPAMVFLLLVPGSVPPLPRANPVGWLPPIAASVAALLPPGLLLQRLGGVRAWPSLIVVAVAMAGIPGVWRGVTLPEMVPTTMLTTVLFLFPARPWLIVAAITAAVSGILAGVILGAGLFLMARLPRAATAP